MSVTQDLINSGDGPNNTNIFAEFSKRTMRLVQIEFCSRGGLGKEKENVATASDSIVIE